MARTRKPAAISQQRPALERWELLGVGGFAFAVFGILALIGEFSRDGVVVAALRDAAALAVGRAAPVMSIVLAALGASLFSSGVRRRGLIRPSHAAAGLLFVAALAALAALTASGAGAPLVDSGGWVGQRLGDGLLMSVGDVPAYLILALAAIASLAYAVTATPWGVAVIGMAGRAVIVSSLAGIRVTRRIAARLRERLGPLFRPAPVDATTEAQAAGSPRSQSDAVDLGPEPPEWRQEPLIHTSSESTAQQEPPRDDGPWELPGLDLLERPADQGRVPEDEILAKAAVIENTLASFGIESVVAEAIPGPVVTQYLVRPGTGVKVSRITALANDLALKLAAKSIRIEAPVPGRPYIGVETPNDRPAIVTIRELMESQTWASSDARIRVALGKDVAGQVRIADLTAMPHLLIAGATGAGKSVCLTSLISCLVYQLTPAEMQLILIDPKMVELVTFQGLPHLRMPVITDVDEAVPVLTWVSAEMARRYRMFNKAGVRNIEGFNAKAADEAGLEHLSYLVVVIDELADLMMTASGDVERLLARLAQMARATGIHLVISTQRPSVDVITGLIKANFPTRVSFMVSSQADARTILDTAGAERLIGRGDMLFAPPDGAATTRIQGVFASDAEIAAVVDHWRRQGEPELIGATEINQSLNDSHNRDERLYVEATELIMRHDSVTPDFVSRELGVGRRMALGLIERLVEEGFLGEPEPQSLRRPVLQRETAEAPVEGG